MVFYHPWLSAGKPHHVGSKECTSHQARKHVRKFVWKAFGEVLVWGGYPLHVKKTRPELERKLIGGCWGDERNETDSTKGGAKGQQRGLGS